MVKHSQQLPTTTQEMASNKPSRALCSIALGLAIVSGLVLAGHVLTPPSSSTTSVDAPKDLRSASTTPSTGIRRQLVVEEDTANGTIPDVPVTNATVAPTFPSTNATNTAPPTNETLATAAPTTPPAGSGKVEALLPPYTLAAIQADPQSVQKQALDFLNADPALDSYPDWKIQQRFALACFFYSNWDGFDDTDWLKPDTDECTWGASSTAGMNALLASPCVGGVFHNFRLSAGPELRQLPPEIFGLLSSLKTIELDEMIIMGTIPTHIGLLSNSLEELNLCCSSTPGTDWGLAGNIPSEVGSLSLLKHLDLGKNHLTGNIPTQIAQLTNLVELDLSNNELVGPIPAEFGALSKLTKLSLDANNLTAAVPSQLGALAANGSLTSLAIDNNALTGVVPAEFCAFDRLNLNFDCGDVLCGCDCPCACGSDQEAIDSILRTGSYCFGSIPSSIGSMANVTQISFQSRKLTGPVPSEIGQLTNLTGLDFTSNELTGRIPSELGLLSGLTALLLGANPLTGVIPSEIGLLTNLGMLQFGRADLSGTLPTELALLNNLHTFDISANPKLSGPIPATLNSNATIQRLGLFGTALSGTLPDQLCNVTQFRFDCGSLCGCGDCPCDSAMVTKWLEVPEAEGGDV